MSLLDDIRKIALSSVLEPDNDAQVRRLHSWFSRTFQIPLPEVEDLPIEYILLHYYEELYSNMDEDELLEEAKYVLETPEQRKARIDKEEALDDEFDKEIREEMEAQKKGENKTLRDLLKKKRIKKDKESIQSSSSITEPPPDIKIGFEENDLMAKYGDMDFVPSKK